MDINEIIVKNELTTREMEFVVEEYIFEKKNQRVNINTTNHPMARMVPPQMAGMILQQQFQLILMLLPLEVLHLQTEVL